MATLRIPDQGRTITAFGEVKAYLAGMGIDYERWQTPHALAPGASAEAVLAAYDPEIQRLKAKGGYVTADVIDGPRSAVWRQAENRMHTARGAMLWLTQ